MGVIPIGGLKSGRVRVKVNTTLKGKPHVKYNYNNTFYSHSSGALHMFLAPGVNASKNTRGIISTEVGIT